jgi:hypothetical protein
MAIIASNQVTRMGMAGGMWQPHGSYAGKVAAVVTPVTPTPESPYGGGGWGNIRKRKKDDILRDDEEFFRLCQEAIAEIVKYLRR